MTPFAAGVTAAREAELSSPWDVVWWPTVRKVVIAMAGTHQLAAFDPFANTIERFAGTGHEGLVDGEPDDAWFAQPSGLAADGERLWVADSETSALRWIAGGKVETAIGQGLFRFGHKDGTAADALLQHPLGVTALPDGSVAICDTYNGAIRRYEPVSATVSTLATGLAEPSGAIVANGNLVVVESAAHRLVAISLAAKYLDIEAREFATQRTTTDIAPGKFALQVAFTPSTGQHFDNSFGPATKLSVSATPSELLVDGAGEGTELTRTLVINDATNGVLHVTVSAATCDDDVEHAACHLHQQDWGIPVRVTADGVDRLDLMLRGMAERTTE